MHGHSILIRPFCVGTAAAAAVVVLLAGCTETAGGPAGGVKLSGACQFRACVCTPEGAAVWQTGDDQPVRWDASGAASCAAGYRLKLGSNKN